MFDIAAKRLAWIPVRWPGVTTEGDDIALNTEFEIECQVEIVSTDRLREIFGQPKGKGQPKREPMDEAAAFRALCLNWRGVEDNGVSVPMTDESVARMLTVPMFSVGFAQCYQDAWAGQLETRAKNSAASSADGLEGEAAGEASAT